MNKIKDCYSEDKEQPPALSAYGFIFWQIKPEWGIQAEVGYSQRNTHISNTGVSHYFSRDYRLKQIEANFIGKFESANIKPRISLEFGVAMGYALSGREYIRGAAVGNFSVSEYRGVDFEYFKLKRFQIGPLVGLELAYQLFDAGEVLMNARFVYYPENDLHGCEYPNESRISLSLGYKWYFLKKTK
jgi:hypothetical protein